MLELPHRVRLAAGDYFMQGQDHRMRQAGLAGNICRVVLRLDADFDAKRLRDRAAASPMLNWLARLRITRPFGVCPPIWQAAAGAEALLCEHDGQPANGDGATRVPPAVLERELLPSRGPALALDLVRRPDAQDLILSWNHALMDVRGAESVLRHLNEKEAPENSPTMADLINPEQMKSGLSRWWRILKSARGSMPWLRDSGREPLFSLLPAGAASGKHRGQNRLIVFNRQETSRIQERCDLLNAGFRRSHFHLAASLRALHRVASGRGNKDAAYLIPVPHDMRRQGSNGPIFSNHLSILFYRIEPAQAGSLRSIIDELSRQMMDQMRTRFPECCMAALDMFRPLPLNYYVRHLGQPTAGKFASLCFSDSGPSCAGMTGFLGARIQTVTHLVPTWRPPGLTILFWNFDAQLRTLLAWVDDCLSPAEVDLFERGLRAGLLEEEPS